MPPQTTQSLWGWATSKTVQDSSPSPKRRRCQRFQLNYRGEGLDEVSFSLKNENKGATCAPEAYFAVKGDDAEHLAAGKLGYIKPVLITTDRTTTHLSLRGNPLSHSIHLLGRNYATEDSHTNSSKRPSEATEHPSVRSEERKRRKRREKKLHSILGSTVGTVSRLRKMHSKISQVLQTVQTTLKPFIVFFHFQLEDISATLIETKMDFLDVGQLMGHLEIALHSAVHWSTS